MRYCKDCWNFDRCNVERKTVDFAVDDGVCFAFDGKPMTNADRIRAMTDEELAKWIASIAFDREMPWCDQFTEKFCISCPTELYRIEETGQVLRLHECDFADGECPHGDDTVWWLQQPAEGE